jgi:4-amino-4-deoxy-L-arabinose transferase-like glycosyltransferase
MKKWAAILFNLVLLFLLALGISYRLRWTNWSQGTSLHPDEYGLTNTLTQLRIPLTLADYFNTRISPISPYNKYDLDGQPIANGPDNRMRWGQWPIILLRFAGELNNQIGYDEIRQLGRKVVAVADICSLLLIFLIGARLFNKQVGLLAATLSSLAVMQIQQSHFMTVDQFGTLFVMLGMYAAVRVAQRPCAERPDPNASYRFDRQSWAWCVLFGVALGMALASKVNLLPLAGMILLALFLSVADLKLKAPHELRAILIITTAHLLLAAGMTLLTFRITQPMTFRAPTGETTFWTLTPNPDWVESMKVAQMESSGLGGGPPGEQWTKRPAIIFPLVNILFWGLGLPLGLAAWIACLWAAVRFFWPGDERRAMLLPLVWTGGYFLFMATRWVKSVRYFLPIYPFLCLFAAWGLWRLWLWSRQRSLAWQVLAGAAAVVVIGGAYLWANAFTTAVYRADHTRIQATRWVYQNVPAPFHLAMTAGNQPVGAPDGLVLQPGATYQSAFKALQNGELIGITLPHVSAKAPTRLNVQIVANPDGDRILAETVIEIPAGEKLPLFAQFTGMVLQEGQMYTLHATAQGETPITLYRTVISGETWDEGLPFPFDGQDPFGQLYRGVEMEVRWPDVEEKRTMFLQILSQADTIILPSQRAIWSACRLPDMYPMTMEYYRALFDGRLGFSQAAMFHAPMNVGPLSISDVGGTFAWGRDASLPLFNGNLLAAEEAFSVYDHPPVWIFQKNPDFTIEAAQAVLNAIDLSRATIQTPRDATGVPCK